MAGTLNPPSVHDIFARAQILTGFTRADIVGTARTQSISSVRFAIVWAMKRANPRLTLARLAHLVGRSDHSMGDYALKRAEELRKTSPAFVSLCDELVVSTFTPPKPRPVIPFDRTEMLGPPPPDQIPLRDVKWSMTLHRQRDLQMVYGGGSEGDPALPAFEIARRRREAAEARQSRERAHLEAEASRYGTTRQTATKPLSRLPA